LFRHVGRPLEWVPRGEGKEECSWDAGESFAEAAGLEEASVPSEVEVRLRQRGSCVDDSAPDTRTTPMLQRIAPKQTEDDVRAALVRLGFGGSFDIVYLPLNRKRTANLGYAFVNFLTAGGACACSRALANQALGDLTSHRPCRVAYSKMQGDEFLGHVADARAGTAERKAPPDTKSAEWWPPHLVAASKDPQDTDRAALAPPPGLHLPHLRAAVGMGAAPVVFPGAVVCGAPISL